ncbi:hypothetical protein BJ508DRAFT_371431 [Ascobolus immersus RN42]|uniref:Uncharacterized protein n=1 Tax=Ascobolus immersus RN42 TaxID=1160509 RepID=A0A3N4IUM7_ASCIM|nr:hypothetical protein BJ508DRAFT_371431 [Ascobolus immersus RN42]
MANELSTPHPTQPPTATESVSSAGMSKDPPQSREDALFAGLPHRAALNALRREGGDGRFLKNSTEHTMALQAAINPCWKLGIHAIASFTTEAGRVLVCEEGVYEVELYQEWLRFRGKGDDVVEGEWIENGGYSEEDAPQSREDELFAGLPHRAALNVLFAEEGGDFLKDAKVFTTAFQTRIKRTWRLGVHAIVSFSTTSGRVVVCEEGVYETDTHHEWLRFRGKGDEVVEGEWIENEGYSDSEDLD